MKGHIIFNSVLGCFVFDKDGTLVEKGEFDVLKKKYNPEEPNDEQLRNILSVFKDKKYFPEFYVKNLEFTKKSIRESFSDDILIMQAIESIDEVNKITNLLVKRLREWYSYYSPELSRDVSDNAKFVEIVVRGEARLKGGMGVDIKRDDLHAIADFASRIKGLYELKEEQASYIEKKMHE